jgi:nitroreductase
MNLRELLLKNRSYRRFFQEERISTEKLLSIVESTRFAPSPANKQPLQYILVSREEYNNLLFSHLNWAAYLKDWQGPVEGERPSAYIVMLGDRSMSPFIDWDYGIALQTILLVSVDMGYGGCAIASFNKEKVRELFNIDERFEIPGVIALGKPKEQVVIDDANEGDIKYWRDEEQVHHVPKRVLNDLIHGILE